MVAIKHIAAALMATSVYAFSSPHAYAASECGSDMSVSSIRIKAKPDSVWKAIRNPKPLDVFQRKVLSSSTGQVTVEDTFGKLPVLGSTTCLVQENECQGRRRVEFSLIKSDKIKEFRGHWAINPAASGNETDLELTIFADAGIKMPFAKSITKKTMQKNIEQELAAAKEQAEAIQAENDSSAKTEIAKADGGGAKSAIDKTPAKLAPHKKHIS